MFFLASVLVFAAPGPRAQGPREGPGRAQGGPREDPGRAQGARYPAIKVSFRGEETNSCGLHLEGEGAGSAPKGRGVRERQKRAGRCGEGHHSVGGSVSMWGVLTNSPPHSLFVG